MKKQYFILSVIACMMLIFNVKAQNTPIDDFLKKYPSKEGVTHVSMSQQMLKDIFTAPKPNEPNANSFSWFYNGKCNVPEAYSSITFSKDISEQMFNDLKKKLTDSKYEQYIEVNRENNILGYYLKELKDDINEIIVLRRQKDQFSAIYIKGDIEISRIDMYLARIKNALSKMGASNTGIFQPDHQFAYAMPSFDNFKMPDFHDFDFKFDSEKFSEEMKNLEDKIENLKFNDHFQRNIHDTIEKAQRQMEEAQRQMEEQLNQE